MNSNARGPRQYRRRGSGALDGDGRGRRAGARRGGGKSDAGASLTSRTAVRALVAAGAYVAQDVRDPDGLTRPMLRRAALRMAVCRQPALRRLGSAYLRNDPPAPAELPARSPALTLPAGPDPRAGVIDVNATGPSAV